MMDSKTAKKPGLRKPSAGAVRQAEIQLNKMLTTTIIQHMHLETIQMMQINALRLPAFDQFTDDGNFVIHPKESIQTLYREENRTIAAVLTLGITVIHEKTALFEITAVYRVLYSIKPSFTADNAKACATAFCKTMALAHVWPYWRESLASICLKMDLPPILAPLRVVGATPTREK